MNVNIDDSAGFCWGVVKTVDKVEEVLNNKKNEHVYVLGQIIHNPREIERLEAKGLKTISHDELESIKNENPTVIIRAHGEPPKTFKDAKELGLNIVDATCPLVQTLQNRIHKAYKDDYQIVIYGKREHAEVIGIRGVCNDECIVIKSVEDALEKVDLNRKTMLFSQTTMDKPTFYAIKDALSAKMPELIIDNDEKHFIAKDTICKYVSGREDRLMEFAKKNDIVIFVAGKNSSNGKILYEICKQSNSSTYFIEDVDEINNDWFANINNIGITGATSTPKWYLELVKSRIENNC